MSQVLLITGASRGIGAATARLAARRGHAVAVNYRSDADAAGRVVAEIEAEGGTAAAFQADVADPAAVADLFERVERALGPISGLVNNAGLIGRASILADSDPGTLKQVVDANVLGVIYCAREAVRRMSAARDGPGGHKGGAIVNLSSAAATLGSPGEFTWYAASKGAVDSFTIGLAKEVGGEGIRVNAVAPGLIETEIHEASGIPGRLEKLAPGTPLSRAAAPEEVAAPILWLLSEEASYITGAILRIAGGR